MQGSCHCGAVHVTVPAPPEYVTECGCSICRRYGTLWSYYPHAKVTLEGPTETYVWGRKQLAFHRCGACGCVMAWWPLNPAYPECGVNARMLEGLDMDAVTKIIEADSSEN